MLRWLFLFCGLVILPIETRAYEGGFSTPVWDTSARWELIRVGGAGTPLFLEGEAFGAGSPVFGFSYTEAGTAGWGYLSGEMGRCFIGWLDMETERIHRVVGTGFGYMDGPFSRARIGAWYYTWHPGAAFSRDFRYMYLTDYNGVTQSLRRLDFQDQIVTTILSNISGDYRGLSVGDDGKVYLLGVSCRLMVLTPDGQIERTVQLDTSATGKIIGFHQHGLPILMDDVNNRLYCNQSVRDWYTFYWDLSDNSFHGLVPRNYTPKRSSNAPGPFDGTDWYGEGTTICFGPDDPQRKFIYLTTNDCATMFRLDLDRKWVSTIYVENNLMRFADTLPYSKTEDFFTSLRWIGNGSFIAGSMSTRHYKRVR